MDVDTFDMAYTTEAAALARFRDILADYVVDGYFEQAKADQYIAEMMVKGEVTVCSDSFGIRKLPLSRSPSSSTGQEGGDRSS